MFSIPKITAMRDNICSTAHMEKALVIAKLREHEPELKAAGVTSLALFGSVARDETSPNSDVDLMAEFDSTREFSLLDRVRLENRLADMLGVPVDPYPSEVAQGRHSRTSSALGRACLL